MDHPCKTCGYKDPTRGRRAHHCASCAVLGKCTLCSKPHGKRSGSKYCDECFATVPHTVYHPKEGRRVVSAKTEWDALSYLGLTLTSHDWARLAAYIDGEGCIGLCPRKTPNMKTLTLCGRIQVTNTDLRLPEWCLSVFGMTIHSPKVIPGKRAGREGNWKRCYYAQATGYRASWIARNCGPWLLMKAEQAAIVVEHQKTTKVGTWDRAADKATPTDILSTACLLKRNWRS